MINSNVFLILIVILNYSINKKMYGQPGMPGMHQTGMHGPGMGHPGMHGQGMGQPEMHLPGAGEQECTNQARMDQVWVIQDIIKYLQ